MKKKQRHRQKTSADNYNHNKEQQIKEWIAAEAARVYVNENIEDLHSAKLKAAARIGASDACSLPNNEEVEKAIKAYRNLFNSEEYTLEVKSLQQKALAAMAFFEHFQPKIVGALLNGTASSTSTIYLHLFTDHAEEVDWFLIENQLPHELLNKTYYLNNQSKATTLPGYRFIADGSSIELSVFPRVALRQVVRCSPKGKTIVRGSFSSFKQLLTV